MLLLVIIPFICEGQGSKGFQALLTIENDVFGLNNKDENYTGGLKLEVLTPGFKSKWLPHFRYKGERTFNIQRFSFGGTAYTPQALDSSNVVIGDRPYASTIYVSFGTISYNLNLRRFISSELFVGILGARGPGNAQAYIHRNHWLDQPEIFQMVGRIKLDTMVLL